MTRVAALYVETGGCYFGLPDVDPWDEERDARTYAGPWPVVAHPPCARWGKWWFGGLFWVASGREPKRKGDDGGCFAAALAAVRRFGGVLEHPEGSHAWAHFGLNRPPRSGGWVAADFEGGWTCAVDQGHYGHRAGKATWLYAMGLFPPALTWGRSSPPPISAKAAERGEGNCMYLSRAERARTPIPFRDLVLDMARSVEMTRAA